MKRSLRSRSLNGSLQLETLTWNYCQCQIAGGNWAQPSLIASRKAQRHPEKKNTCKIRVSAVELHRILSKNDGWQILV